MPDDALDLLLLPTWLVPVEPAGVVLTNHALGVREGRIALLAPREQGLRHAAREIRELPGMLLAPGLVNAHGLAASSLLRGMQEASAHSQCLAPLEQRWVDDDFVRHGCELAAAEMTRSGITCFSDSSPHPEVVTQVVHACGLRAQVCVPLRQGALPGAADLAEAQRRGLALFDDLRHHPRIRMAFAPQDLDDNELSQMLVLAEELEAHIQLLVTPETRKPLAADAERPLARLSRLGLLGPRLQAVHMTLVSDEDLELLVESNASVIHCPTQELKQASGFCPTEHLWQAGVNVALGCAAAAGNPLDVLGEARLALLLSKALGGASGELDAHRALRMATLNGARALGLDDCCGSLQLGKFADLVAFDLRDLEQQPVRDPVAQLILRGGRDSARHLWVAGKPLLEDRQLKRLDEIRLRDDVERWQRRLAGSDA